jgi:hypothetical protein
MREGSSFSPTLPDDEDGYVPAPGAPSQERPEYEGEPSFSVDDDVPIGDEMLRRTPAPDGSDEQIDHIEHDQGAPVDPDDPSSTSSAQDLAGTGDQTTQTTQGEVVAKPPTTGKGSGKDAWITYAKSLGHTDEQLEGLSYEQLVAMFADR